MLAGGHSPRSVGAAWRIPPNRAMPLHGTAAWPHCAAPTAASTPQRCAEPSRPPRLAAAAPPPFPCQRVRTRLLVEDGLGLPAEARLLVVVPPLPCGRAREDSVEGAPSPAVPHGAEPAAARGSKRAPTSGEASGEKRRRAPCATSEALPALYCVTLKTWWFLHFGALQKVRSVFGAFTCGGERGGAAGGGAAAGGGGAAAANVAQARAGGGPRGRADHAAAARLHESHGQHFVFFFRS